MSSHRKRMKGLGQFALSDKGSEFWKHLEREFELDMKKPEIRRLVEQRWEYACSIAQVQELNGAGYYGDQALREFVRDYNSRAFHYGLQSMPMSWNVAEAFVRYVASSNVFRILVESDHRLSFGDYLDWFTVPGRDVRPTVLMDLLDEEVVHHYNNLDDPCSITAGDVNRSFGLASISLVRSGTEVVALCVLGQLGGFGREASELLADTNALTPVKGKEHITPHADLAREAVTLESSEPMWRHVTLVRYDLESHTYQTRYVLRDLGNGYDVITDDRTMLLGTDGKQSSEIPESRFAAISARLVGYSSVFDSVQALLCIPAYLHAHESKVVDARVPTQLSVRGADSDIQEALKVIPKRQHYKVRCISTLAPQMHRLGADERVVQMREMHLDTSGYWRTLEPGKYGIDKRGQAIQGKTWVHRTESWVEAASPSHLVLRAKSYEAFEQSDRSGWIYILRSAMHPVGVFKIGMTGRSVELRANELSGTSSPDRMFVMHRWSTVDCARAEASIHKELNAYRINPHREFFSVDLEIATSVIAKCVAIINSDYKRLNATQPPTGAPTGVDG